MKRLAFSVVLGTSVLVLLGCSEEKNTSATTPQSAKLDRQIDARVYSQGQKLYQQNCAVCHGKQREGAADWRQRDADGAFPPPPLNGTGHTWHHPTEVLVEIIKNGTAATGGKMPAWKDVLSDAEIHAILDWITAQWSDEIYQAWYTNQQQAN